jgi:hypothetical protein
MYLHGREVGGGVGLTPASDDGRRRTSGIWVATGREVVTSVESIEGCVAKDKNADWPNADARR